MNRWRELLTHLYFENSQQGAKPASLPLLRKLVRLVPDGVAFLLFNFGSSFAPAERPPEPEPRAPERIAHLHIGSPANAWPQNLQGDDRGLPYSDGAIDELTFRDYEIVEDPVYAMREIHRVCRNNANIRMQFLGAWSDPLQRRIASAATVAPLLARDSPRGSQLGLAGLFEVEESGEESLMLRVRKKVPPEQPSRIDIGCGLAKRKGYCGIDIAALPGVDIVCDVVRKGLPFSADTITAVSAIHFLEHAFDLVFVMNEIHRVSRDGAVVEIEVPTLLGPWAAADPTHRHLFNARTFGYFTEVGGEGYAGIAGRFQLVSQQMSTTLRVTLRVVKTDTPAA